jgi:two-component system, OmpR family, sensor histidine kinase QseC
MKLFTKYNRVNLLISTLIFIFSSIAFYIFIRFIIIKEVDDDLKIERREIRAYITEHKSLPEVLPVRDLTIRYTSTDQPYTKISFRTFGGYDSVEKEKTSFREMVFGINASGKEYQVSVIKSLEVADQLLHSILVIAFSTILLMLVTSYIINRLLLKRLWKPFYDTLSRLKLFSLTDNEPLHFQSTKVEEFSLMNNTLEAATSQAQQDYIVLKEFTENASHEMQTPLAIIRSKLDVLIQDEHLSETQSLAVQTVYDSIQKLNRLNQSLLLLAKIGNRQFEEVAPVDLARIIQEKTEAFHELWVNENISVNVSLEAVTVKMNKELADILLNNLLSNATKHNSRDGNIHLVLNETGLTVSNTGQNIALDNNRLFTRFYTPTEGISHNGLGLSIIKNICDVSGFTITYSCRDQLHTFMITW